MLTGVRRALRLAGLACAGALLGVTGAFLHATSVPAAGADLPVLLPVVLAVLAVAVLGGSAATGSRVGAALPAAGWLVGTLPFAVARPEGDLVVAATGTSTAYLLLGTVVVGTGVGLSPAVARALLPAPRPRARHRLSGDRAAAVERPSVGSSG